MNCKHPAFTTSSRAFYLESPKAGIRQLMIGFTVKCKECGQLFTFDVPQGISSNGVSVSPKGELLIPAAYPPAPEATDEDEPAVDTSGSIYVH